MDPGSPETWPEKSKYHFHFHWKTITIHFKLIWLLLQYRVSTNLQKSMQLEHEKNYHHGRKVFHKKISIQCIVSIFSTTNLDFLTILEFFPFWFPHYFWVYSNCIVKFQSWELYHRRVWFLKSKNSTIKHINWVLKKREKWPEANIWTYSHKTTEKNKMNNPWTDSRISDQ